MPLPLEGIKVIDMTQIVMGPTCTRNLADQGADVVKVEPPRGDDYRTRYTTPRLASHNQSRPFLTLNRNKRSIVVDLATESGRGGGVPAVGVGRCDGGQPAAQGGTTAWRGLRYFAG